MAVDTQRERIEAMQTKFRVSDAPVRRASYSAPPPPATMIPPAYYGPPPHNGIHGPYHQVPSQYRSWSHPPPLSPPHVVTYYVPSTNRAAQPRPHDDMSENVMRRHSVEGAVNEPLVRPASVHISKRQPELSARQDGKTGNARRQPTADPPASEEDNASSSREKHSPTYRVAEIENTGPPFKRRKYAIPSLSVSPPSPQSGVLLSTDAEETDADQQVHADEETAQTGCLNAPASKPTKKAGGRIPGSVNWGPVESMQVVDIYSEQLPVSRDEVEMCAKTYNEWAQKQGFAVREAERIRKRLLRMAVLEKTDKNKTVHKHIDQAAEVVEEIRRRAKSSPRDRKCCTCGKRRSSIHANVEEMDNHEDDMDEEDERHERDQSEEDFSAGGMRARSDNLDPPVADRLLAAEVHPIDAMAEMHASDNNISNMVVQEGVPISSTSVPALPASKTPAPQSLMEAFLLNQISDLQHTLRIREAKLDRLQELLLEVKEKLHAAERARDGTENKLAMMEMMSHLSPSRQQGGFVWDHSLRFMKSNGARVDGPPDFHTQYRDHSCQTSGGN